MLQSKSFLGWVTWKKQWSSKWSRWTWTSCRWGTSWLMLSARIISSHSPTRELFRAAGSSFSSSLFGPGQAGSWGCLGHHKTRMTGLLSFFPLGEVLKLFQKNLETIFTIIRTFTILTKWPSFRYLADQVVSAKKQDNQASKAGFLSWEAPQR